MIGLFILLAVALAALIVLLTAVLVWEMRHPPRHTAGYAIARGLAADPGELDLQFESWTLDRPDGARLPVWDIQIVNRQSSVVNRLTAVFIHGWGRSRIDSLARIKPFDRFCDRIVMYDLRGHGETSGSSRLGDSEEDDLLALLDRFAPGSFVLVGHSMGAVIALRAAIKRPRNIAGVIAYGPYCEFHRSLIGRLHDKGFPSRPMTDLAMLVQRACGIRPASVAPSELESLRLPLLVIHGVDDPVAPVEHGRRIAGAARDCTSVEIAGAMHTDAQIVDPIRHDGAVTGFLERIAAPAAQPV